MKYLVVVKADHNDADYIEKSTLLREEDYSAYKDLLIKVSNSVAGAPPKRGYGSSHNWERGERADTHTPEKLYSKTLSEQEIEDFDEKFVPYDEYGVHTIVSILVHHVAETEDLF